MKTVHLCKIIPMHKKKLFIRKKHIYIPIKLNIVLYLSGLNDIH